MTVAELLSMDQLKFLYIKLGLESRDVEKAEAEASTTNENLKAKQVLLEWRKNKGHDATRECILEALDKCGNTRAIGELLKTWS